YFGTYTCRIPHGNTNYWFMHDLLNSVLCYLLLSMIDKHLKYVLLLAALRYIKGASYTIHKARAASLIFSGPTRTHPTIYLTDTKHLTHLIVFVMHKHFPSHHALQQYTYPGKLQAQNQPNLVQPHCYH